MDHCEVQSTTKRSYLDVAVSQPPLPKKVETPLTGPRVTLRHSRPKAPASSAVISNQPEPAELLPQSINNWKSSESIAMDASAHTPSQRLQAGVSTMPAASDPMKPRSEMLNSRLSEMNHSYHPPAASTTDYLPNSTGGTQRGLPNQTLKRLNSLWETGNGKYQEYAQEMTELARMGLPPTTGNGLLDAVRESKAKQADFPYATRSYPHDNTGIRAAVAAAARAYPAGNNAGTSSTRHRHNLIAEKKKAYKSKPVIPLDHDHSKCSSWITYCGEDEVPAVRPTYPFSKDHGMNTTNHGNVKGKGKERMMEGTGRFDVGGAGGYGTNDQYYGYREDDKWSTSANMSSQGWYETDSEDRGTKTSETGPSSTPGAYQSLYHPGNVGWSSSQSWVSPTEKERASYNKIKAELYHGGMSNSPVVPASFNDFLKLKSETYTNKRFAAQAKLEELQQQAEKTRRFLANGGNPKLLPPSVQSPAKLREISADDGLTAVGSRNSIWTSACLEEANVDWPSLQEYKSEGDHRGKSCYGRYLPLPRIQKLADEFVYLMGPPNCIPLYGPKVPRQYRKLAGFALYPVYDGITTEETDSLEQPAQELRMEDLNETTREFMEYVDRYGDDEVCEEHEEECEQYEEEDASEEEEAGEEAPEEEAPEDEESEDEEEGGVKL
ncbi:hypothetical protein F5B20DRAFT_594516 [Whalleya microplaca]|nr:hypothetical protein F5B20DRAFT_594516 [Whalleya microplaca]